MADPINIKFPMRRGVRGAFETNDVTLDAVRDDLKILILTNHGDRPIHGDFGANLRSVIFEPHGVGTDQKVKDLIAAAVEKWMPFVNLVEVNVTDSTTDPTVRPNQIHIKIRFSVGNIDDTKILDLRVSA